MKSDISFLEFVEDLRKRPGIYIGSKSITRLHLFMLGWMFGNNEIPEIEVFNDFTQWVRSFYKFDEHSPQSWAQIILFHAIDEAQAFDQFLILFDKFVAERSVEAAK